MQNLIDIIFFQHLFERGFILKKLVITLLLILISTIFYFWFSSEHNQKSQSNISNLKEEVKNIKTRYVKGDSSTPIRIQDESMSLIKQNNSSFSLPCIEDFRDYLELTPTKDNLKSIDQFNNCNAENLLTEFGENLKTSTDEYTKKVILRAIILDYMTRNIPLSHLETNTLLYKAFAQSDDDENNNNILMIAEELNLRDEQPRVASELRAKVYIYTENSEIDNTKLDLIAQELIRTKNIMTLLALQNKALKNGEDIEIVETYFQDLEIKDSYFFLYKAVKEKYKDNNSKLIISHLNRALSLDPNNKAILKSLESYKTGTNPRLLFPVTTSFEFD